MVSVVVVHQDERRLEQFSAYLASSLRGMGVPTRILSLRDPAPLTVASDQGSAPDIICIDARQPRLAEALMKSCRRGEYVLLDASHERLVELLPFKPVAALDADERDPARARRAVSAALHHLGGRRRFFCVQTKTRSLRIPYDSILYFESCQRRVTVHASGQGDGCSFTATLSSVEKSLPPGIFVRCHQSFLVCAHAMREVDRTARTLVLEDGSVVSVSDSHYKDVVRAFTELSPLVSTVPKTAR